MRRCWLILVGIFVAHLPRAAADMTLPVLPGAAWRYLDDGSDQGTAWREPDFDDTAWCVGAAQLGYGDGDEVTEVSFGPDPRNKHVTTYFRHAFVLDDAATVQTATLAVIRDDGAIVYLNGTEVFRSNIPDGPIDSLTLATTAITGDAENEFVLASLPEELLVTGENVLAVEIHQQRVDSADVSFDLVLIAEDEPAAVVRGPYLQQGTASSVVVRWRTNYYTDSRVHYGTNPGVLDQQADDPGLTTDHEMVIDGLQPETTYHYAVGTSESTLAGGDALHSFVTPPLPGAARATRIWAIGDSGTGDANAAAVYNAYLNHTGSTRTDVWLMLGDNAYPVGSDPQYRAAVFDMYVGLLPNTFLWPTIGNHDAVSADSPTESGVYYDVFTLPRAGEAGGIPSGTEAYYAFDHGNIHFICLDSEDSDRGPPTTPPDPPGGAMFTWLEEDLADTTADWIIAFWHHPPYSKGSHDSDNPHDSAGRMIDMREIALPILEAGGVDLVLTGHSHTYERSFLLDGAHGYGTATPDFATLLADGRILDTGDGRPAGAGAYVKPTPGLAPHEGTVYIVAGSSGKATAGNGTLDHPVMFFSIAELGSVVLDVEGLRLNATFLDATGAVRDWFAIDKGPSCRADVDGDGDVDVDDLVAVIVDWGTDGAGANSDVDGSGTVDVDDLVIVIVAWGPCA